MKTLYKQLKIRKVAVDLKPEDIIEEGLPGVLPKFTTVFNKEEYYVKRGLKEYASCNMFYQVSEVIAYEIGQSLGFDVCPYEMWEIPASNFMEEFEVEDYFDEAGRYRPSSMDRYLRENRKVIVSASKSFLPSEDHEYLSAATIIDAVAGTFGVPSNPTGKTLYDLLIASGYYTKEYLDQMIVFDYIIYNVDRHVNNFGYLTAIDGSFSMSPLFDHGRSLLSDFTDREIKEHREHLFYKHTLKPFYDIKESLSWISKESFVGCNFDLDPYYIDDVVGKYDLVLGTARTELICELIKRRTQYVRKVLSEI